MAYVREDGEIICNPPAGDQVKAKALLLLVREGSGPGIEELRALLTPV